MANFLTDDDRPPIEVVAGSIRFYHGFPWKEHGAAGRRKWRPDHSKGHSVDAYEVVVGSVTRTGEKVSIEYNEEGTKYEFRVERVQIANSVRYEPLVISDQPMDQDCDGFGISFGKNGSGRITRVAVDGNDLPLSGGGNVRVKILPQRTPSSPREVKRLLALLLARLARLFDEDEKRPRRSGRLDRGRSRGKKPVRRSGKS